MRAECQVYRTTYNYYLYSTVSVPIKQIRTIKDALIIYVILNSLCVCVYGLTGNGDRA
jgi:hypothetical protein